MSVQPRLRLLWLCGVPKCLEENAFSGRSLGSIADWSWVVAHLPPPDGVELHIACPAKHVTGPCEVGYRGAIFHLFPYPRGAAYVFYRSWLPGFRRVYDRIKPDWVHGWGTEAGFGSATVSLTASRSIVGVQGILSDYHPYMAKSLWLYFAIVNERLTLRKARRLLSEGEYSAQAARKYTSGKVGVIAHPLRADFLTADLGGKNKRQVAFLGALTNGKGIRDAIRAFGEASPDDWSLLCAGRGTPGYEREVNALLRVVPGGNRVTLCGLLDSRRIVTLFQESPVFLLPSYMDTGPTALKEAIAMGLWPVCYDNSGPKELIERYRWGTLSPTGDISALTENLRRAFRDRPWQDRGRMTRCVRQARYDLSRETVWGRLLECYTEAYWACRDKAQDKRWGDR